MNQFPPSIGNLRQSGPLISDTTSTIDDQRLAILFGKPNLLTNLPHTRSSAIDHWSFPLTNQDCSQISPNPYHRQSTISSLTWHDMWVLTWHDTSSWGINWIDVAWHVDVDVAWHITLLFPSSAIGNFSWKNLNIALNLSTPDHRQSEISFGRMNSFTKTCRSPTISHQGPEISFGLTNSLPNLSILPSAISEFCWRTSTHRNFDQISSESRPSISYSQWSWLSILLQPSNGRNESKPSICFIFSTAKHESQSSIW